MIDYLKEEAEAVSAPIESNVNTTSDMVVHKGRIGKIIKRRKPKMKNNNNVFSTVDIQESKLSKNEYESLLNKNNTIIVPIDEEGIEYKLLNFDEYGRVYENLIIVNETNRTVYIEVNSKETLNYLLTESNRNKYVTMRLLEMKHIYSFTRSLVEGYQSIILHNNNQYNIRF